MISIKLTQSQIATVDTEDADLAELQWFAYFNPHTQSFYARRNFQYLDGSRRTVALHRIIGIRMASRWLETNERVDHHNHDTLNNSRSNLRVCTAADNQRNTRIRKTNKSGYKGVCWSDQHAKWRANIKANGKQKHLGLFSSQLQAALAYNRAAIEFYGEFAKLNEVGGE